MSIEDRLRSGLAANTEHLAPDPGLELQLGGVLRRAHRRRRARVAGLAVVAAAVAVAAWLGGVASREHSDGRPGPVHPPDGTTDHPWAMEGVNGALEAGAWVVPLFAQDYKSLPRAVVQVPPGFGSPGGWVVDRGADGDPRHHGDVSFHTIDTVVGDACANREDRHAGPAVEDLARAFTRGRSDTTGPRRVTLDGRPAEYVEITLPGRHRLAGCTGSAYTLWREDDGTGYQLDVPGTVVRLWILDVAGTRVEVVATTTPHETAADVAEVVGIARSTHFIPPPDPGR